MQIFKSIILSLLIKCLCGPDEMALWTAFARGPGGRSLEAPGADISTTLKLVAHDKHNPTSSMII